MTSSIGSSSLGTYAASKFSQNALTAAQKDYDKASMQTTTGMKAQTYGDNAAVTRASLDYKVQMQDLEQIESNVNVMEERVNRATTSLDEVVQIAQDFKNRLKSVMQPGQNDPGFSLYCQQAMIQLEGALNVRDVNGNSIFGNTDISTNPFNAALVPVPTLNAPLSQAAYQGTDLTLNTRISLYGDQQTKAFNNCDAYMQLFQSLSIGAHIQPDYINGSDNMAMLVQAQNLVDTAEKGVLLQRENVQGLHVQIIQSKEIIETQRDFIIERQQSLDHIDVVQADMQRVIAEMQAEIIASNHKSQQRDLMKFIDRTV